MKKSISELQKEVHELAKDRGWYDGTPRTKLELISLIHAELSEAVEEIRKDRPPIYILDSLSGKPEGELIELADAVIRIMDYCEFHGLDLEAAIKLKHEFNKTRPYRHGGKKY